MALEWENLTHDILAAAYAVHTGLGPGLLESVYRRFLVAELADAGFRVATEVPVAVTFKGRTLDAGYRADLIVDDVVLVELKCVEKLLKVHEAQTLTYMKLSGARVGLLLNFNVTHLRQGIRRFVR